MCAQGYKKEKLPDTFMPCLDLYVSVFMVNKGF
jgi:hypothetical protein